MIESVIFYFLSVVVIGSALLVVSVKNVFHSALYLILSLVGIAGFYAMLAADFLFAVQILVYAGGIMVLMLFVVLMSGTPADWSVAQLNEKAWGAVLFCFLFIALMVTILLKWVIPMASLPQIRETTGELGELLFGPMILPLEMMALVMIVGLVGAIYFSSKRSH